MIPLRREPVKKTTRIVLWVKLFGLLLALYLVFSLTKGLMELKGAYRRLDEAQSELAQEEEKAGLLKQKYTLVQTREYLEEVARNKLNMQKEGETVVVLAEPDRQGSGTEREKTGEERELPTWEKWWNLIK